MSIQVDWALIQQLVSEYTPKKFSESADGYKIFEQTLGTDIDPSVYDIIDQEIQYSTKVDIAVDDLEQDLIVLAPSSLLAPVPKLRKKRQKARTGAASTAPREFLMRIPIEYQVEEDFNLFKDCTKLGIGLTEQTGPYLCISPGRISLTFGLYLSQSCSGGIPDSAIRQSQTAAQVFARVLNKPEILEPPQHEKNLEDMFEALTSPKNFSNDPITVPGVLTPLQKFQCQSVRWCLAREGCALDGNSRAIDCEISDAFEGWYQLDKWWVNPYSVQVQTQRPEPRKHDFGGLLAEEMGLGKTLEVISLIKLHPRPPTDNQLTTNENTGQKIRKVSATLVIVPSGIMDQWVTELESHAPGIKITQYSGKGTVTPDDLDACDVVLASYSVIASEFYSAQFNPGQRNTRFWKEREDIRSVRSSLVQVQFWRVVLDEVQMLHAGVNNAARVAGLVPRVNAWAVTGTPVKNSMSDLRGQFSFLQAEPFAGKRAFERLLTIPQDFKKVVSQVGIRHTKFLLRDELRLPPQRRRLIMPSFNEMERLFYESVREDWTDPSDGTSERMLRTLLVKLRQACCINSTREQSVFSDSNGATLTVEQALLQLTHEGESRYTRLLRYRLGLLIEMGQLKLMAGEPEQAIELLVQQLEPLDAEVAKATELKDKTAEKKRVLEETIKHDRGVIKEMTYELEMLGMKIAGGAGGVSKGAEGESPKESQGSPKDSQTMSSLADATDDEVLKIEPQEEKDKQGSQSAAPKPKSEPDSEPKPKSKHTTTAPKQEPNSKLKLEPQQTSGPEQESEIDTAQKGAPESIIDPKELVDVSSHPEFARKRFEIIDKETALDDLHVTNHYYSSVIKSAIIHINACKELQHRAFFFLGTCYYRLGQSHEENEHTPNKKEQTPDEVQKIEELSQKELDYYSKADDTRGELLNEEQAEFLRVRDKLKEPSIFEYESPKDVYQHFFNDQAEKMREVYVELMAILKSGLLELNTDNEDVYTTSMEVQDKGYVYLNALQTMLSDREQILNSATPNAKKIAGKRKRTELDTHNEERSESVELFEKELKKNIAELRKPVDMHELAERKRVEKANEAKFKSLEKEYRRKKDKVSEREREREFNLEKLASVEHENSGTLKSDLRAWKREVGVLSDVFNARLKYFKSLQDISDHVREPEFADVNSALARKQNSIKQAEADLESAHSRLRFIAQLEAQMPLERESRDKEQQDNECVICQDTYIHGSFTTCGHRCCTPCLSNWLSKNPICPICKTALGPSDVFQFRFGDSQMSTTAAASSSTSALEGAPSSKDDLGNDVYEHISSEHFNEILRQPLKKTYGIKIDMIVRHVLLLKQREPDVQVVVFTQWSRMLQALTHALIQHGVRALRKTQPKSVTHFRTNKDITCFMLHTSNDSAGLTLTNATHVILCEPLLTTAIELQAISRIHRIGQFHPTTVWLFAIQDTVEQQILALATERRIEMAKQKRQSDEAVESDILTSTVGPLVDKASGSEVIVAKDIRRILGLE